MGKTLVIAEKPSVGRDLTRTLPGAFQKHEGYLESDAHVVTLGRRPSRAARRAGRVRPQVQEVEDGRPADRARRVPPRRARRALEEAVRRDLQAAAARRRRPGRQRVRRRARGRADLRVDVREGEVAQAGAAAVAVVDDRGGDQAGVRGAAPGVRVRAARGGGAVALGGRLDRRHELHARGDHPAAVVVRRRGVARPRADADAGDHRPPRGGDPGVRAGAVLARRRGVRAVGRRGAGGATTAATTPARSRGSRPPRRRRRSSRRSATGRARSPSSRRRPRRTVRRSCTTSPPCSATPTRATGSRRGGRWRRRSGCTRTTRR